MTIPIRSAAALEAVHEAQAGTSLLGRELKWSLRLGGDGLAVPAVHRAFIAADFPIPSEPSKVVCAERAVEWGRTQKLLPPVKRRLDRGDNAAWSLQTERKLSSDHLLLEQDSVIRLDSTADGLTTPPGEEFGLVSDRYQHNRGHFFADDISAHIKRIVRDELSGQPLWNDGNDYFVPPELAARALQLRQAVRGLCPPPSIITANAIVDEPELRGDTVDRVMQGLVAEINTIASELTDLAGSDTVRSSTYLRRAQEAEALLAKLALYERSFRVNQAVIADAIRGVASLARRAATQTNGGGTHVRIQL